MTNCAGGNCPGEGRRKTAGAPASPKSRRQRAEDYTVIVDLPDPLPITEAEIELLEAELADFIVELLKK